jgi:hypothetical protein
MGADPKDFEPTISRIVNAGFLSRRYPCGVAAKVTPIRLDWIQAILHS